MNVPDSQPSRTASSPIAHLRDLSRGLPRPEPGTPGDPGLFGPGSIVWRVNGEAVTILGGGRALLMQLADPMVAAGVADHSRFEEDAFERLWRTLDSVLTVIFGDTRQAEAAAARVNRIHDAVRGERDGRPYRATDPELLLWVHATLVDTALLCYERFIRPLSASETERYLEEMVRFAELFGIPSEVLPRGASAFRAYVESRTPALLVTSEARRLAEEILRPAVSPSLAPARAFFREVTAALLPPPLRAGFDLRYGRVRDRSMGVLASVLRRTLPVLPSNIRRWPHAEAARARVRA
jgi:uncharacterized protein (DUF2236 family)